MGMVMAGLSFRRGDVYWVNLDPTIGTEINIAAVDEQTGYHPGPGGLGLGAVGALVRWCAGAPQTHSTSAILAM